MGPGVTQSHRRVRVVGVPRRHEARFRQQARFILVLAATLGAALAAFAAANGYAEFTPVIVAIAVVPFLGGLVGLWRLVAAWEAGPGRAHAVLAAFSLGLVSWAITFIVYLIERARGSDLLEFPSIVDIPNYASALFWTIGVWLLYEGGVDDFLEEVKENSYFLTLIALLCFFVLTVAEGNDYGRLLWSGDDLAKRVTEALLPLAWGVNGFLLFRAGRGKLGKRWRVKRTASRALALGLTLAAVSDLLFAVEASLITRDPVSPLAYRNGGPADTLAMVAYLFLAFGVLHFPLDAPLFHPADAKPIADNR
jgi:hypothetical protein